MPVANKGSRLVPIGSAQQSNQKSNVLTSVVTGLLNEHKEPIIHETLKMLPKPPNQTVAHRKNMNMTEKRERKDTLLKMFLHGLAIFGIDKVFENMETDHANPLEDDFKYIFHPVLSVIMDNFCEQMPP